MRLFGASRIEGNDLIIGDIKAKDLAKEYGTPLYVMDEELLLEKCRGYVNSFKVKEENNRVAYAGKAFLTIEMCKLINKEGLYRYPMYREDAMDNLLTFVNKNTINLNLTNTEKEYTANELLDYLDNEGLIKEISEDDDEL